MFQMANSHGKSEIWGALCVKGLLKSPVSCFSFCQAPIPHHFSLLQDFVYITQVVWLDSSGEFLFLFVVFFIVLPFLEISGGCQKFSDEIR